MNPFVKVCAVAGAVAGAVVSWHSPSASVALGDAALSGIVGAVAAAMGLAARDVRRERRQRRKGRYLHSR